MKLKTVIFLATLTSGIVQAAPVKIKKGIKYRSVWTLRMVGIPSDSQTDVMEEVDLVTIRSVHLDAKYMCNSAVKFYTDIAMRQGKNYTYYCKRDE